MLLSDLSSYEQASVREYRRYCGASERVSAALLKEINRGKGKSELAEAIRNNRDHYERVMLIVQGTLTPNAIDYLTQPDNDRS